MPCPRNTRVSVDAAPAEIDVIIPGALKTFHRKFNLLHLKIPPGSSFIKF